VGLALSLSLIMPVLSVATLTQGFRAGLGVDFLPASLTIPILAFPSLGLLALGVFILIGALLGAI